MQACHAALEIGLRDTNQYHETSSIVLLQIQNKQTLEQELQYIQSINIDCASFIEPYNDMGLTAFATIPITEDKRELFKKYTLWGRAIKGVHNPIADLIKMQMKEQKYKENFGI